MRGVAGTPVIVFAAAVLGASSCVSLPPALDPDAAPPVLCESRGPDNDGDGYPSCGALHVDCNDDAAAIHHGALEICGDGIDQDCAGDDLPCADELSGNTAPDSGDPWTVGNEAYDLTFDRSAGSPFGPIALRDRAGSGNQLLNVHPSLDEHFFAVTRWQQAFSWRAADAAPSFTVPLSGAAVTRVDTAWADGGDTGTSAFTLYPDGRIHRHDEVTVTVGGGNYLTSYISLDAANRVDRADWAGASAPVPLDLAPATVYQAHQRGTPLTHVCLFSSTTGDRVTLAARPVNGADGLRVSEANRPPGPIHIAGMAFDWQHEDPVAAGVYVADLLVVVGHGSGARPCLEAVPLTTAFLTPPLTTVAAPGSVTTTGIGDADGDGYHERYGWYEVSAGDAKLMTLTLSAPVPSLALRVTGVPNDHDPVLVRDSQRLVRGRDYHLQHGTGELWLFAVGAAGTADLRIDWP